MKNNNSLIKKLLSVVLAASMLTAMLAVPVLAEDTDTPVHEDPAEPQTIGPLLAGGSGSVVNGVGIVRVYLSSNPSDADVKAGTVATGVSGTVDCYFTTPDGDTFSLGTILADGDVTDYLEVGSLSAGTYTFTFEASTSDEIDVFARIYQ